MIPEADIREGRRMARIWGHSGLQRDSFAAGYALGMRSAHVDRFSPDELAFSARLEKSYADYMAAKFGPTA